jgi:hypothetical protein
MMPRRCGARRDSARPPPPGGRTEAHTQVRVPGAFADRLRERVHIARLDEHAGTPVFDDGRAVGVQRRVRRAPLLDR